LTERIPSALPKPSKKPNMVNKKGKSNPPYPLDLRKKVCEAVQNGMGTCEAGRVFKVRPSTISRWKKIGELPKNAGRPTKNSPIEKANSNSSQENEEILKNLLAQLPLDNEMEARKLAVDWDVATAINYCRVILPPNPSPARQHKNISRTDKLILPEENDEL
jgi:transposase